MLSQIVTEVGRAAAAEADEGLPTADRASDPLSKYLAIEKNE